MCGRLFLPSVSPSSHDFILEKKKKKNFCCVSFTAGLTRPASHLPSCQECRSSSPPKLCRCADILPSSLQQTPSALSVLPLPSEEASSSCVSLELQLEEEKYQDVSPDKFCPSFYAFFGIVFIRAMHYYLILALTLSCLIAHVKILSQMSKISALPLS